MVVKKAHFQCVALILLFNIKTASCLWIPRHWPQCLWGDAVIVFNMISASICFHYKFGFPRPSHCCCSVCVCVVLCEHSLSVLLAAMTPGTSVDPWEPFSNRLGLKWICTVLYNEWCDQELRAAYDFMETSSDNGRLVCADLNRSGQWMTTTSVSGVSQRLCRQGNSQFTKCRGWGRTRNLMC